MTAQATRNRQWQSTTGDERQLQRAILGERLDHVAVLSEDRGTDTSYAGFPLLSAGPCAVWAPPGTALGAALPAPYDWNPDADTWQPAPGAPAGAWPGSGEARFFMHGENAVLRWDAGSDFVQCSAACGASDATHACLGALIATPRPVLVQSHQTALQTALASAGFRPQATRRVALLAPQLAHTEAPLRHHTFEVSAADIDRFGQQTGDLNPLHFDDGFAQSCGFSGRIAHGMLFSGWLTRVLGTEYPGPGTIFLRSATVFLAPVYPGLRYDVVLSTPVVNAHTGFHRVVAQLLDPRGKHCLVSYNELLLRRDVR